MSKAAALDFNFLRSGLFLAPETRGLALTCIRLQGVYFFDVP